MHAAPLLVLGQLVLFFSGNFWDGGPQSVDQGYGIWRASGFDTDATSDLVYGVDFVVRYFVPDSATQTSGDLVASWAANVPAGTTANVPAAMYLDPDPVLWYASSHVVLFFGRSPINPRPPGDDDYLARTRSSALAVARAPQDAWV